MKTTLFVLFFIFGGMGHALAQGKNVLCLHCESPDKAYRCSVIGSGQINPKITKLYCLIKTAKEQKHARCRVKQTKAAFCPDATEVTYLYEGPNIPGLTTQTDKKSELSKLSEQNRKTKARGEPGTLVELTEKSLGQTQDNLNKAGEKTQKALKKTGQALGSGAKNIGGAVKGVGDFVLGTTKCIFTLFTKCNEGKAVETQQPQNVPQENRDLAPVITPNSTNDQSQAPVTPPVSQGQTQPSFEVNKPRRVTAPLSDQQ